MTSGSGLARRVGNDPSSTRATARAIVAGRRRGRSIRNRPFLFGGYYFDRLVRAAAGWRIAERVEETAFIDRPTR